MLEFHDLNADTAIIDYDILFKVVSMATAKAKSEVENHLSRLQYATIDLNFSRAEHESKYLAKAARDLEIAMETYHVMVELADREKLVFTNLNKEVTTKEK